MPTIATIKAKLNDAENRVLSEWAGAGSVKRLHTASARTIQYPYDHCRSRPAAVTMAARCSNTANPCWCATPPTSAPRRWRTGS